MRTEIKNKPLVISPGLENQIKLDTVVYSNQGDKTIQKIREQTLPSLPKPNYVLGQEAQACHDFFSKGISHIKNNAPARILTLKSDVISLSLEQFLEDTADEIARPTLADQLQSEINKFKEKQEQLTDL